MHLPGPGAFGNSEQYCFLVAKKSSLMKPFIFILTISIVFFSARTHSQAARKDALANEVSNVIQPRIYLCKKDEDCSKQIKSDSSSVIETVKDIFNVLRGGDQMKCHRNQFCIPEGSDLALNPFPNQRKDRSMVFSHFLNVFF